MIGHVFDHVSNPISAVNSISLLLLHTILVVLFYHVSSVTLSNLLTRGKDDILLSTFALKL